ncbi:arylsulfatase B-like [Belonocnema kinseyi]|uniref:arylsulfatase B-like n=1 Tax=Belonocnema kinseyi TaxID=2817044 RepID=UPI00143D610D|nr:arylsulfatase B-like [Belonocnema kinseyi]
MKSVKVVKSIIVLTVPCLIGISVAFTWDHGVKTKKPHIIFIMADDLGWNDVSFHGADQIPTPNIDALAYNGIILNRYYVQPTCTPSRTAFLTGRYPIRTGMQGYPLKAAEPRGIPLNETLLPAHLKKLGYVTRLLGKWHTGYYTKEHTPANRGFDSFFGYYNGMIQYFNHTYIQDKINRTGYDLHRDVPNHLNVDYTPGYFTDILSNEAEEIINKHDPETPLFLEIAHLAPHCSDAVDPLEVRDLKEIDSKFGYIQNPKRRKFAGMMTALDESVGRTVSALKKAKMLENSIIVFASDNGAQSEGFLENAGSNYPLRGLKFSVYEGGIRAVACVYSPLIKKRSRLSNIFMHVTDWLPTFYSAAGGSVANLGEIDGVDQWSKIRNDKESNRKFLLVNIDDKENTEAAIYEDFKIVIQAPELNGNYYGESGNNELYPKYNITRVLNSLTNLAINENDIFPLSSKTVKVLRSVSELSCKELTQFANCSQLCLFNIQIDPCETLDLSSKYPNIVKFLENKLDDYRHVLKDQTNAPFDPAGNPENFNGTWMPWRSNDENK